MDDGEALDWLKISEMTPKLKTKAACRSHTFVCGCLWAVTSSGTYVCGCQQQSTRSKQTNPRQCGHIQDLVWRRRLASSQSLHHRQPFMALLARTGHRPVSSHRSIRVSSSCGLVYSKSRLARLGPRHVLDSSPAWPFSGHRARGEAKKWVMRWTGCD
ncbi:hypothetical protein M441DRAFT_235072 [Trichoderma asperellum CBS 433.97]|uniref:Uncharacterized protein n=1 Tax=Trichoderma asperellum (strain ATCC 204424 / CBS 433.97 / NBRC 101777) TaxID=1042311 RepID=A0A2T3Z139_TRIA4|nr:hypothetical protein M441DRAFT_235072 [Trichoderma asperellum CBS 433.97]PTB38529.1 hypothetical protein M441DRAFT_235072 [Trichoderma asperellum CBS 433.97]